MAIGTLAAPPLRSNSTLLDTGAAVRAACRSGAFTSTTSGLATRYIQANLIILPSRYADDFRSLCVRNPVPCPLLAESAVAGSYDTLKVQVGTGGTLAYNLDIRRDAPKYMVYHGDQLVNDGCLDIVDEWTDDHVAFLIGCSFSFEAALAEAGLIPRHTLREVNVPMYRTHMPLCPAGVFNSGTYIVSMRPYKRGEIEEVMRITRPYLSTHGEPIAWGWQALEQLGIQNIDMPEWGDAPVTSTGQRFGKAFGSDDEMPVFWGCGVTTQEAVMNTKLEGTIMAHKPGHMLVLDCQSIS